jgi:death-on-curing protein
VSQHDPADGDVFYPDEEDVFLIHDDVIESDPDAELGVRNPDVVESALYYVSVGYFGQVPETIHEKAAHLMRLLAAEHAFVDGNKRTALGSTALFYDLNDRDFDYDDEVRAILEAFATDSESVEIKRVIDYCRNHTTET